jgi:hypothetical protein
MAEEMHELHERAHEAGEHPSMVPVTITMSILAVLVAATSLMGHRAHTEELLAQSEASDLWAEYQAKSIRRHGYEQVRDLLQALGKGNAASLDEKYQKDAEKALHDQSEIQEKAHEREAERDHSRKQADRFDLGEVLLEASLVITSLTLLTHKGGFWIAGSVLAACGLVVALSGLLR